jgi:Protein of unknown function (DUF1203)
MTATRTTAFQVHALPAETLDAVRLTGVDVSGHPIERMITTGGEPLRCCLRNAVAGEQAILFGFEPTMPASPYREIGAVFAHAQPCGGPAQVDGYPADWRGKPQVLRAYDRRGWIHNSTQVHDGTDPEAVIDAMLADPEVAQIHSRNVAYGCYMFSVSRPDQRDMDNQVGRKPRRS